MEPTQSGEDQPEEREKRPPAAAVDGGSCAASDAVVAGKACSTEMKEMEQNAASGSALAEQNHTPEKAQREMDEDSAEETYVIESSPEKQPSETKTKEDSLKSPAEEVFSIDDDEEPLGGEAEEDEGAEEEVEDEMEEEEMFGEMDEDEEIYVEATDRVDANELSIENSESESDISSDEYTDDEEAVQTLVGERKEGKNLPIDRSKVTPQSSRQANEVGDDEDEDEDVDEGEEEDDDEVQILTDDDELEEDEDNAPEEDEEDDDDDGAAVEELEEMEELEMTAVQDDPFLVRKFGPTLSPNSDKSESPAEKSARMRVKYRNYQHKLAAFLRKRSLKILKKRSMHVMEDSSDALVVCSDANLSAILKSAPQQVSSAEASEHPEEAEVVSGAVFTKLPNVPETVVQTCTSISATATSSSTTVTVDGSQSKTKEAKDQHNRPAALAIAPEAGDKRAGGEGGAEEKEAVPNEAISSSSDKMPTATAIELTQEKIADSSDDALSAVLASKKSISAAAAAAAVTPSANSGAASSQEPGEGKAKESNANSGAVAMLKDATDREAKSVDDRSEVVEASAPSGVEAAAAAVAMEDHEPTADDVMEGIDDFMDHNGSEGKEQNGDDFNEDLTFQMDVDVPGAGAQSEPAPPSEKTKVEERVDKSDKPNADGGDGDLRRSEESAMDLTATSESTPPSVVEKEQEPVTLEVTAAPPVCVTVVVDVVDSSPEKPSNQRRPSSTGTRESDVNMRDKTIITSTPIAASSGSEKRTEGGVSSSLQQDKREGAREVKRELADDVRSHSEEADEPEAGVQNLSTSNKAASASAPTPAPAPVESSQPQPVTSRKRRRAIDRDDGPEGTDAEPREPIEPAKKLKLEVEANYQAHERVVNEYIDTTSNTSVDEIQCHADTLVKEIQNLNNMIRETEQEWNNLLHLKKVKEEILLRLNRRKHVIGITETRLGEVSAFSHLDSSNLSSHHQLNNHHHHHHHQQRSSSVGPRPPTPPPEVEIRPASVSASTMNYNHSASNGVNTTAGGGKHSQISNRRNSSTVVGGSGHANGGPSGKRTGPSSARDTNSFVSQFNSNNNAVTMVPLQNPANMILQARASMNAAEIAKEKAIALQVQRQLFPKPVLSNQQQILNNLAMSAGLTSLGTSSGGSGAGANSGTNATALLNGHHGPGTSTASSREQQQGAQQLQIGRQGMRKDVSSIIADYRQKHPENVPRRGRRLKHVGGGSNNGSSNSGAQFGEGGAISLTALPGGGGGKSPATMGTSARSSSADSVANRLSELLAAAENSRPSSNDSSQSSSHLLSSLVSASGAAGSQQQFLKDVLVQFAKMSQNEQSLLSNLQLLANNAVLASTGPNTATTNTVSSPQQSPQYQHHQHQQQQHQQALPQLHASLLAKASLPEVTLHPVMNSTAHSDLLGSHNTSGGTTLTGANLSAVNTSSNSLLHGILTKSASRPASGATAAAAAAAVNNFNTFSPTLARLLTGPERMNAGQSASASSSTVTSGALANLQSAAGVIGGLNLSKNNSEISITPVVGTNFQQTLLAQQQQQHQQQQHQQQQQQLQRLREQHLFKGESYLNIDDEADDSVDRLVIDEGDDQGSHHRDAISKRRVAEINENEVPQCQGCKKMEAKFVCAGCNHQWYCSRECQVNAWDDHSEVCSG